MQVCVGQISAIREQHHVHLRFAEALAGGVRAVDGIDQLDFDHVVALLQAFGNHPGIRFDHRPQIGIHAPVFEETRGHKSDTDRARRGQAVGGEQIAEDVTVGDFKRLELLVARCHIYLPGNSVKSGEPDCV